MQKKCWRCHSRDGRDAVALASAQKLPLEPACQSGFSIHRHPLSSALTRPSFDRNQVDGSTFSEQYASRLPMAARPDLGDGGGGMRAVVDLLVS
jgi:hypothetical protein